jgi:hypothetical protein
VESVKRVLEWIEECKHFVRESKSTVFPEESSLSKLEVTSCDVPKATEIKMTRSNVPKEQEDETADGLTEFYWDPLKKYFKKDTESLTE